jgi:hypothetical protein
MNRDLHSIVPRAVTGLIVSDAASLDALDMMYMNFARLECDRLAAILEKQIIPAMGGYDNELACDISRHLEQIRSFSGNFCWKHRHVGASHGVVGGPNDLEQEDGR